MNEVLLSIIVPVYNVEDYIEQCLNSIFNQNFSSYEVILVNDGSTDKSIDKANKFTINHPNLTILHKKNGGLSSARNYGFLQAKGKYIWYIDSDDWIEANILNQLMQKLETFKPEALLMNTHKALPSGERTPKRKPLNMDERIYEGKKLFWLLNRQTAYLPTVWLFIYRKDILESMGLRFVEGILHEDEPFTLRFLSISKRLICIDNPYYFHRVRSGSIMRQDLTDAHFDSLLYILNQFLDTDRNLVDKSLGNFRSFHLIKTLIRRIKNENVYHNINSRLSNDRIIKQLRFSAKMPLKDMLHFVLIKTSLHIYWKLVARPISPSRK